MTNISKMSGLETNLKNTRPRPLHVETETRPRPKKNRSRDQADLTSEQKKVNKVFFSRLHQHHFNHCCHQNTADQFCSFMVVSNCFSLFIDKNI